MALIKRYANRKLYNSDTKQYVTLEGIADLIRQGESIQIVDHESGEDLTALTLTQIIFEQEKKVGGILPPNVLTALIQMGSNTLQSLERSISTSPVLAYLINQEITNRVEQLVTQGELSEAEGEALRQKLTAPGLTTRTPSNISEIASFFSRRGMPNRNEVHELISQLETLTARIEQLSAPSPEQTGERR